MSRCPPIRCRWAVRVLLRALPLCLLRLRLVCHSRFRTRHEQMHASMPPSAATAAFDYEPRPCNAAWYGAAAFVWCRPRRRLILILICLSLIRCDWLVLDANGVNACRSVVCDSFDVCLKERSINCVAGLPELNSTLPLPKFEFRIRTKQKVRNGSSDRTQHQHQNACIHDRATATQRTLTFHQQHTARYSNSRS